MSGNNDTNNNLKAAWVAANAAHKTAWRAFEEAERDVERFREEVRANPAKRCEAAYSSLVRARDDAERANMQASAAVQAAREALEQSVRGG